MIQTFYRFIITCDSCGEVAEWESEVPSGDPVPADWISAIPKGQTTYRRHFCSTQCERKWKPPQKPWMAEAPQ